MVYRYFYALAFSASYLLSNDAGLAMDQFPDDTRKSLAVPAALSRLEATLMDDGTKASYPNFEVGFHKWKEVKRFVIDYLKYAPDNLQRLMAVFPDSSEMKDFFFNDRTDLHLKGFFDADDQEIDVIISKGKHGFITFQLLESLTETFQSISSSLRESFSKAAYVKRDLETIRRQVEDALKLIHYNASFFNNYFGNEDQPFSARTAETFINNPFYVDANTANSFATITQLLTSLTKNQIDGMGYLWYMNRHLKLSLQNCYYMLTKHIENTDRWIKGKPRLEKHESSVSIADFEKEIMSMLQDKEDVQQVKKKKKKKKKKKPSADQSLQLGNTVTAAAVPATKRAEEHPPISPLDDNGKEEADAPEPAAVPSTKLHPLPENPAEEPMPEAPVEEGLQIIPDLQRVHSILDEYDVRKGMKSHHFIAMITALSKLGHFKDFKANNKGVSVTIPRNNALPQGYHANFHLNHSNRRNETGLTQPTANKARELVEALMESVKAKAEEDKE